MLWQQRILLGNTAACAFAHCQLTFPGRHISPVLAWQLCCSGPLCLLAPQRSARGAQWHKSSTVVHRISMGVTVAGVRLLALMRPQTCYRCMRPTHGCGSCWGLIVQAASVPCGTRPAIHICWLGMLIMPNHNLSAAASTGAPVPAGTIWCQWGCAVQCTRRLGHQEGQCAMGSPPGGRQVYPCSHACSPAGWAQSTCCCSNGLVMLLLLLQVSLHRAFVSVPCQTQCMLAGAHDLSLTHVGRLTCLSYQQHPQC